MTKSKEEVATTTLLEVHPYIDHLGRVFYQGSVKPVTFAKKTFFTVNLGDYANISTLDINIGDELVLGYNDTGSHRYSLYGVKKDVRVGRYLSRIPKMTTCPVCQKPLVLDWVYWTCVDPKCSKKNRKHPLSTLVSKEVWGVPYMTDEVLYTLVRNNWLMHPLDLFFLPTRSLTACTGIGPKRAEKIRERLKHIASKRPFEQILEDFAFKIKKPKYPTLGRFLRTYDRVSIPYANDTVVKEINQYFKDYRNCNYKPQL